MSGLPGKKRRQQPQLAPRIKTAKGSSKPAIEDIYPFQVPNLEAISPEVKQYINQLERQYLERYNILINNRIIYQEILDNISTELDQRAVGLTQLAGIYQHYVSSDHKGKEEELGL